MDSKTNDKTTNKGPFAERMGDGPGGELFTELCNLTERYWNAAPGTATTTNAVANALTKLVYAAKRGESCERFPHTLAHALVAN